MIPIHQLLSRIRWDPEFGRGRFELGYLDRVERRVIRIPFQEAHFAEGNRFSFEIENLDGTTTAISFHRVREVFRDGKLIWQRPASGEPTEDSPRI